MTYGELRDTINIGIETIRKLHMVTLTLKAIDSSNWRTAIKLDVHPDQQNFVAPNVRSLAQAHYDDEFKGKVTAYGLYDDEIMVGFTLVGNDPDDPIFYILRFMIGADYQRKGYGRAGMLAILALAKANPQFTTVRLSYVPDNVGAKALYASVGFSELGIKEEWGEMEAERLL